MHRWEGARQARLKVRTRARSGSLHDPVVVMGNLAGGFAMLALLGWLYFKLGSRGHQPRRVAVFAGLALLALCTQILLGGFTSANFAATSCQTLSDCHGGWWPGAALSTALDLSREHEVTSAGQAVGGEERVAIHRAHRLGAIAAFVAAVLAAGLALSAGARFRPVALLILGLVVVEFGVGLASVVSGIPIALAVSHNFVAALLLLALLKLLALSTPPRAGPSNGNNCSSRLSTDNAPRCARRIMPPLSTSTLKGSMAK